MHKLCERDIIGALGEVIRAFNERSEKLMDNKNRMRILFCILFLLVAMLLGGCDMIRRGKITAQENGNAGANQAGQEEVQSTADLAQEGQETNQGAQETGRAVCMIVSHDTISSQITVMNLSDGSRVSYKYTDGTEFFDKYGNYTLGEEFRAGKLAVIERLNSNGTLGALAFTDSTWEYENVRNYSAETDRFLIADTSYQYDGMMKVFSDGEETDIYALGETDILNVYGIGRRIYSIVVETGHGTLALTNTKLFEGGWLNLGTKVYTTITKDMTMDIPEGVYNFSVANDGYGDSGEILIRRDKTTTIDLNDYKGEGPKMCTLTFNVGVDDAVLTIDGKKINYKKPKKLRYGVYNLGVFAQGYDTWTKKLAINSPTATIDILLSEDTGSEKSSSTASGDKSSQSTAGSSSSGSTNRAGSMAGSLAGSRTGSSTAGSSSGSSSTGSNKNSGALADAALNSSLASIISGGDSTDYLDTLSGLVDSLEKLNRPSSKSAGSSDE